jgi:hypothetical protein
MFAKIICLPSLRKTPSADKIQVSSQVSLSSPAKRSPFKKMRRTQSGINKELFEVKTAIKNE